jgi:hypothetical protein
MKKENNSKDKKITFEVTDELKEMSRYVSLKEKGYSPEEIIELARNPGKLPKEDEGLIPTKKMVEMAHAEIAMQNLKNPNSQQSSSTEETGCFIATKIFSIDSYEVSVLSAYRDKVLINSIFGKLFIQFYYKISPGIITVLDKSRSVKKLIKRILIRIVRSISDR